ncbi:tripartite motif-containing protein 2-like isoform X2 [Branchiostoma floridae]|uniref:Tripartite motif-containing protein 2-like isoform X2 n=1 Tax=Branchiostoma floridae TaxID=7739 RepID=A0A9J7MTU0_BRAFL|nr:tripartite motif-containing protein 2-like isoform X2 [Branchiostoma floridae]
MSLSLTFVTTVSLAIVVPVLLTHFNRQPGIHGSPATTIAGPKTTDSGAWQSSAVLMGTDKVTSADVIKVSPVHGRGPSPGITAEMEAAGPAPINLPGSTGTGETSDQASRPRIITFGDEPGAGKLRSARGVAVSPDNKIWVADRSTPRLKVYSMEGVYLHQFPQAAPGLGYSSKTPSDVSIDKDGHLWVLMIGYPASPDSVVQVTRDGDLKANFDLPGSVPRGGVRGMAVGLCNNHVYVTWSDGHSRGGVQAFTPDGKLLWNADPRMKTPIYVAVDGKENIFVSDYDTSIIYMYDKTGRFVKKFGGPGLSGGRLNRPEGICVDSSGQIMVVDALNKRVVMYTGRGEYVRHIALRAESPPAGVAVGPGGQLVVAHSYTITVFPRY